MCLERANTTDILYQTIKNANLTWHHGDGVAAVLSAEGARRTHPVVPVGEEGITEHDGVPERRATMNVSSASEVKIAEN